VAGSHKSNNNLDLRAIYRNLGISSRVVSTRPCAPVFVNDGHASPKWFLIPKIAPSKLEPEPWPESNKGWRLLRFKGHLVSVEICSDFVNSGKHSALSKIRPKIDRAALALVPACNPEFAWFGAEFRKRWSIENGSRRQRTVYANASGHGDSLIFCNDSGTRAEILSGHVPFNLRRVMYRMPMAGEGFLSMKFVWTISVPTIAWSL